MAKKKETEDKIVIKCFKDGSSNWWVGGVHYHLNKNNEIVFCAGGIKDDSKIELLRQFIKRNGKVYKEREISPYINQKEYLEVITFGKHSGKNVQTIFNEDAGWLKWCRDKYSFSSTQEKLKQEIIEILK